MPDDRIGREGSHSGAFSRFFYVISIGVHLVKDNYIMLLVTLNNQFKTAKPL